MLAIRHHRPVVPVVRPSTGSSEDISAPIRGWRPKGSHERAAARPALLELLWQSAHSPEPHIAQARNVRGGGVPFFGCFQFGAGPERMYLGPERRINPRHRIVSAGVIWRKGHPRIECTVQDFSPAGAGVLLADAGSLPAEFDLTFDRATRHCAVVWRHLDRMGVKFKSS